MSETTSQMSVNGQSGQSGQGSQLGSGRSLTGTAMTRGQYRPEETGFELQYYIGVILDRRWILLGLLVLGLSLAGLWTASQPKIYEARASVMVEASLPQVLGSEVRDVMDPSPGNFYMMQDYLQTSRRVITSDTLAKRVVDRLRLLAEPGFWIKAGVPKTPQEAAERLISYYGVDVVPETRILLVTARHQDPAWAKRTADAVADEFVESNQHRRDVSTAQASTQLATELDELRKSVQTAETALSDFKDKHDLLSVSLEDKANQVARQIDKYTDALTEVRLRKLARESQLEELRKLKQSDPLRIPLAQGKDGDAAGMIQDLRRIYIEEERRLAELGARYQDDHPLLQQQKSKVNQVLLNLKRETEVQLTAAEVRYSEAVRDEQKILAQQEQVKQEGLRLTRLEIGYNKLKRDAESLQKQYTLVLNRTKETGMVGRLKLNNVSVLDYARLPQAPISPKLRSALLMAGFLSMLLGVLLVFALDALDRSVKSQEDVENRLMLPFLGMMPRFEPGGEGPVDLYVSQHSRSTVAEAVRTIRTNVLFAGAERPLKKILVTSSVAREGKTLSCVSLGTVLSQSGQKTLIIDADLRRPRVAKAMGIRGGVGLTNVLLGDVALDDAIRPSPVENLFVMTSGPIPPNPAELLAGHHFRELLDVLCGKFDRVLIDSPPAVPVTDPAVLSTEVDGVVLVVRHGKTSRDVVKRAAKHILDVGGEIIGVVLNDVDTSAKGYRAYYGMYYHYYQSEYRADEEDGPAADKGDKGDEINESRLSGEGRRRGGGGSGSKGGKRKGGEKAEPA